MKRKETNKFTKEERAAFVAERGNKCDGCGRTFRRMFAHHSDYGQKPTDLLCGFCHQKLHHAKRDSEHTEWAMQRFLDKLLRRDAQAAARELRKANAAAAEVNAKQAA